MASSEFIYDYDISGFARFFARVIVKQQVNKPFIGKSYLLYGQCFVIWSYFFKLGGILSAKHSTNLDAFGHTFLGARGPSGAVKKYFTESAEILMTKYVSKSKTFVDYVGVEFIDRINIVGYEGNALKFLLEHCRDKMKPEKAEWLAYLYAEQGAILGAIYPDLIKKMFSRMHVDVTNVPWTKETVELACSANINISNEQDLRSYEDTEKADNEMFMEYLRDICPDLYIILSKSEKEERTDSKSWVEDRLKQIEQRITMPIGATEKAALLEELSSLKYVLENRQHNREAKVEDIRLGLEEDMKKHKLLKGETYRNLLPTFQQWLKFQKNSEIERTEALVAYIDYLEKKYEEEIS